MAEEAIEVHTNGKFKLPWAPIVGFLFAALMGVLQWVALEERTKFNERHGTLERNAQGTQHFIRPPDAPARRSPDPGVASARAGRAGEDAGGAGTPARLDRRAHRRIEGPLMGDSAGIKAMIQRLEDRR